MGEERGPGGEWGVATAQTLVGGAQATSDDQIRRSVWIRTSPGDVFFQWQEMSGGF